MFTILSTSYSSVWSTTKLAFYSLLWQIIFPELLTTDVEHTDWATGQDFLVIQTKQMPDDVLN